MTPNAQADIDLPPGTRHTRSHDRPRIIFSAAGPCNPRMDQGKTARAMIGHVGFLTWPQSVGSAILHSSSSRIYARLLPKCSRDRGVYQQSASSDHPPGTKVEGDIGTGDASHNIQRSATLQISLEKPSAFHELVRPEKLIWATPIAGRLLAPRSGRFVRPRNWNHIHSRRQLAGFRP